MNKIWLYVSVRAFVRDCVREYVYWWACVRLSASVCFLIVLRRCINGGVFIDGSTVKNCSTTSPTLFHNDKDESPDTVAKFMVVLKCQFRFRSPFVSQY